MSTYIPKLISLLVSLFVFRVAVTAQNLPEFAVTPEWLARTEAAIPAKTTVDASAKRKILLFSLHTGFNHWVTPHSAAVVKMIGKKTGAFEVTETFDATRFTAANLTKYDAVVLNNNCSIGPRRDLFYDALEHMSDTTARSRQAKKLENNLLNYVKNGGGLMVLHGAIVMQNNSAEVSEMIGGSFDYHPAQQLINVKLVDPRHNMVRAFEGKGFQHIDEPYFFKAAYKNYDFRPLLYIETSELKLDQSAPQNIKYISWIKKYGKGRVFYSSPSHNAQSYDNPELIAFLMDGMQYVTDDLKCDDSPIGVKPQ